LRNGAGARTVAPPVGNDPTH